MVAFANRVRFLTTTTGTGTLAVSGSVGGYQTPDQAGVPTGSTVGYAIEDGLNFEVGQGVYTTGPTPTLTRATIESSSNSGAAISLSGSAVVFFDMTAAIVASLVQPAPFGGSPTMNSTAAPGTSALYARGDHVHPTDTSRAAVTALPAASTTTPTMDGAGAIGTGTSFARNDHQHPTDTSRAAASAIPAASSTTPNMDGTAAIGTGITFARADHTHPTDTSRAAVSAIPAAATTVPAMNGTGAVGTGTTFARADHVHPSDTSLLPLIGGTLSGPLTLAANPTVALGAATKQYVDGKAGVASFNTRTGAVGLLSTDVTGALGYTPFSSGGGNTSGPVTVGGALNASTLQATSSFSATVSGWAYTGTGPGSSSGTFAFGVSAGSANAAANFFFAVSDRRTKEDIKTITGDDGIAWVQKAHPVTYRKFGSPGAGFISQEQIASGYSQYVATVPHEGLPEETDEAGVTSSADVALHLDYDNYVAYLTAALQSTLQRLAAVEAALVRANITV